jgi:hypothetical protein
MHTDEVITSSRNDGNTNVGCCTSLVETAMQKHIVRLKKLRDLYELGTPQHNCFSIAINEAMVELKTERQQIEFAFSEGFGCSCFSIDKSAEEYFNNTFKK